jgi:hypothetical protein
MKKDTADEVLELQIPVARANLQARMDGDQFNEPSAIKVWSKKYTSGLAAHVSPKASQNCRPDAFSGKPRMWLQVKMTNRRAMHEPVRPGAMGQDKGRIGARAMLVEDSCMVRRRSDGAAVRSNGPSSSFSGFASAGQPRPVPAAPPAMPGCAVSRGCHRPAR